MENTNSSMVFGTSVLQQPQVQQTVVGCPAVQNPIPQQALGRLQPGPKSLPIVVRDKDWHTENIKVVQFIYWLLEQVPEFEIKVLSQMSCLKHAGSQNQMITTLFSETIFAQPAYWLEALHGCSRYAIRSVKNHDNLKVIFKMIEMINFDKVQREKDSYSFLNEHMDDYIIRYMSFDLYDYNLLMSAAIMFANEEFLNSLGRISIRNVYAFKNVMQDIESKYDEPDNSNNYAESFRGGYVLMLKDAIEIINILNKKTTSRLISDSNEVLKDVIRRATLINTALYHFNQKHKHSFGKSLIDVESKPNSGSEANNNC